MFQTRSELSGIAKFHTMKEAVEYAKEHPDVWKISFGLRQTGERIRLVRFPPDLGVWVYAPITDILDEVYKQHEIPIKPSSERR
jgi:hypothetical protein